jgi:trk system potassium uptake protein TrkH
MFISAGVSFYYSDDTFIPLLYSALITGLFGLFPLIFIPAAEKISNKEALLIVVASWITSCLLGTLPYLLWNGNFSLTDAWFESVSGFTTTGSTILVDIEALPHGLLFWRAATHWIGGTGIIIFALAVLPFLGIAEMVLFKTEISKLARENFKHRARSAIRILFGVYITLTLAETLLLMYFGMSLFDAVTHSFATIATGGFSPKNASVAFYNSPAIETVIMVFMILSGIHFAYLFLFVTGKLKIFLKSTVVRYYLTMLVLGTLIVAVTLHFGKSMTWIESFRYSSFQIISVGTSTGFATADSSVWPPITQLLIIFFTLQCACAGSTSGGIKVDRVVLMGKAFVQRIKSVMYPNAVIPIRLDEETLHTNQISKILIFILSYLLVVFLSTLLLTALDVDVLSAFSGSIAAMGNVGPGLSEVGSIGNYSQIPIFGKWILTFIMILGRLEIFAFFVFLTPGQWRKTVSF